MALPQNLQPFRDNPKRILDKGFIQLIDVMGDDMAILDAARISYNSNAELHSEIQNKGLIRYLMRHWHTTPSEMASISFRVKIPMDAWRQMVRHRTASINELSTRYREAIEDKATTQPDAWRIQAKNNKQGSKGFLTSWPEGAEIPGYLSEERIKQYREGSVGEYLSDREKMLHESCDEIYKERLALGVAREQARKDLPLSNYTETVWKMDLHNLLHFLRLRLDTHAQLEIRLYAQAIAEVLKEWVPWTWQAFEDYRLKSITLSRMEKMALTQVFQTLDFDQEQLERVAFEGITREGVAMQGREINEFRSKLCTLTGKKISFKKPRLEHKLMEAEKRLEEATKEMNKLRDQLEALSATNSERIVETSKVSRSRGNDEASKPSGESSKPPVR